MKFNKKTILKFCGNTILILIIPFIIQPNAYSQNVDGWRGIEWGTHADSLVKEFDGSEEIKKNTFKVERGELFLKYHIEDYNMAGESFRVGFFFNNNDKIIKVSLSHESIDDNSKSTHKRIFNELKSAFISKYNNPNEDSENQFSKSVIWIIDSTQIELSLLNTSGISTVSIVYSPINKDYLDKL